VAVYQFQASVTDRFNQSSRSLSITVTVTAPVNCCNTPPGATTPASASPTIPTLVWIGLILAVVLVAAAVVLLKRRIRPGNPSDTTDLSQPAYPEVDGPAVGEEPGTDAEGTPLDG
jgi:H+/gluconate symporter-like permease